nr:MAG TPA: DNA binding protein [Microviridae sp.]
MKLHVMSVKDNAAQTFGRPFFMPSTGVALRSFTDEVNRAAEDNQLYKHPEDFDLYQLGTFDDETGVFELLTFPKVFARAKEVAIEVK